MNKETEAKTIDEYIARYPADVALILEKTRAIIHTVAPEAQEDISYRIPVFRLHGPLVYFAAYRNHIGFYPTSSGIDHFKEELSQYKTSWGAVQFPLNKEIPYDLIGRITAFRVAENIEKRDRTSNGSVSSEE